jgi:hypothetical protein
MKQINKNFYYAFFIRRDGDVDGVAEDMMLSSMD